MVRIRDPSSGRGVEIDAVVFDMDGVLTHTASLHERAWKRLFDRYLGERRGEDARPLTSGDYRRHVDGKPRYDGVEDFLASRDVRLPRGEPDDPPDRETICGLGNRKNAYFHELLEKEGAQPYEDAVELVEGLRGRGAKLAVISASRNGRAVLEAAGLNHLFDVRVDGVDADELGLDGKPAPDVFLEAARRLGVEPERTAVVEDSEAGVAAGRRGGFGWVVGVDRAGRRAALERRGADAVVERLDDLELEAGPAPGPPVDPEVQGPGPEEARDA